MITVETVRTRAQLDQFMELPWSLGPDYADRHVPLLRSDIRDWFHGRGWFPGIELLLAVEHRRVVGRCITHRSSELDQKLGYAAQLFGALDADREDAVTALLAAVEQRAGKRSHVFGPVTPLPNVVGGAVTGGFDSPGFMDTAWNPPAVPNALAAAGYQRWGEADTWEVSEIPQVTEPTAAEWGTATLRYPRRFGLADELLSALNASFSQLPYYTRISRTQLKSQMSGLGFILDRKLIPVVEIEGQLASFALVIPDPVDILRRGKGRIGVPEAWRILRATPRDAVLIIQGTRPEFQGRGLLSLLTRQLYVNLRRGGYQRLRVTFIGRDNPASARVFEKVGGYRLHEISFYHRELS